MQHAVNRRSKNRLGMRNLQSCAKPCNALLITRNEQVSGSSPLVGSPAFRLSLWNTPYKGKPPAPVEGLFDLRGCQRSLQAAVLTSLLSISRIIQTWMRAAVVSARGS
jgi:hypothetical protein